MKIRKEDVPQLGILTGENPLRYEHGINPFIVEGIQMAIQREHKRWLANTIFITKPFAESAFKAKDSIMVPNLISEVQYESGIFISDNLAIFYHIEDANNFLLFTVGRERNLLLNYWYRYHKNSKEEKYECTIPDGTKLHADWVLAHTLNFLLFKKYAKTEVVHTKPDERKQVDGVSYKNLTKNNISVLDSKWFREIVNSNKFSVRGHFRLQAYGPNLSERKLIFIDEFVKNGYHRTAKVDKNE